MKFKNITKYVVVGMIGIIAGYLIGYELGYNDGLEFFSDIENCDNSGEDTEDE